jgi:hypothetical protein
LWPVGQRLIDLDCARVHDLPLSEKNKQRFGIEDEWCTPEVSAALRAKLGLDKPETNSASLRFRCRPLTRSLRSHPLPVGEGWSEG